MDHNLVPKILGLISIAIIIDVFWAAKQGQKETSGDTGEMYFRFFFGGLQKMMIAIVIGMISAGWWIIVH